MAVDNVAEERRPVTTMLKEYHDYIAYGPLSAVRFENRFSHAIAAIPPTDRNQSYRAVSLDISLPCLADIIRSRQIKGFHVFAKG